MIFISHLCSETSTSSLLRLPEKVDLKKDLTVGPKCWLPGTLSLPFHYMLNFQGRHQLHSVGDSPESFRSLLKNCCSTLSSPRWPSKGREPAAMSWHFPQLPLRNSWAIIEGYSGIPIGLTGAHILNRADTKFIQLLECYYSLRNPREVSDADL